MLRLQRAASASMSDGGLPLAAIIPALCRRQVASARPFSRFAAPSCARQLAIVALTARGDHTDSRANSRDVILGLPASLSHSATLRRGVGTTAAAQSSRAAADSSSSPPPPPVSTIATQQQQQSHRRSHPSDARIDAMFHDPAVAAALTGRQRTVFQRLDDEPPLPLVADHGSLYATSAADLEGRAEAVHRVLSTRTGDTAGVRSFRRSELRRKFGTGPFDTGSSRVQVAMMSERIGRMSSHLSANKHDKSCKRQLSMLTVRRRHLMEYMMRRDFQSYRLTVTELALRPLSVLHSKYLPKERAATHAQVHARNNKLKNRTSRGHAGH